MSRLPHLELGFKNLLAAGYEKTSEQTGFSSVKGSYNCIAWAAHDPHNWWWPSEDGYWPSWIKREDTVFCFIKTFRWLGYRVCESSNQQYGFEKVALYAIHRSHRPTLIPNTLNELNTDWQPTHMARQLPDGTWTSKCGWAEDITHYTLDALDSYGRAFGSINKYGCAVLYMRRFCVIAWMIRLIQHAHRKMKSIKNTISEAFRKDSV